MRKSNETRADDRRAAILNAALRVFGRHGYHKTSVQDVADAAGLSKPGLYLHFTGKDELFAAAMERYLSDALVGVRAALDERSAPFPDRLARAMDAWFGRHLATFAPEAFDVIEAGDRLSSNTVEAAKHAFQHAMALAFIERGFDEGAATDRAHALFLCGLSWKQPGTTPERFRSSMDVCVRVCCSGDGGDDDR